jgi:hypothetical protein
MKKAPGFQWFSALPTLKIRSLANALAEFLIRPASSSNNSATAPL